MIFNPFFNFFSLFFWSGAFGKTENFRKLNKKNTISVLYEAQSKTAFFL